MPSFILRPGDIIHLPSESDETTHSLKRANLNFDVSSDDCIHLTSSTGESVSVFGECSDVVCDCGECEKCGVIVFTVDVVTDYYPGYGDVIEDMITVKINPHLKTIEYYTNIEIPAGPFVHQLGTVALEFRVSTAPGGGLSQPITHPYEDAPLGFNPPSPGVQNYPGTRRFILALHWRIKANTLLMSQTFGGVDDIDLVVELARINIP